MPEFAQDALFFVGLALILVGGSVVKLGICLWRAHAGDYQRNRERTGSFMAPLRGTVGTAFDGIRDHRVAAGLAVNLKTGEWVEQGKLSEEALDSVLYRKH